MKIVQRINEFGIIERNNGNVDFYKKLYYILYYLACILLIIANY